MSSIKSGNVMYSNKRGGESIKCVVVAIAAVLSMPIKKTAFSLKKGYDFF